MRRNATRTLLRTAAFVGLPILAAPPPALLSTVVEKKQLPAGVVVEWVASGSAGEKAGIRPGDVLLSWFRLPNLPPNPTEDRGTVGSPFDLADVEVEQAPRGEVRLSGTREGKPFSAALSPGDWKINTRPQMPEWTLSAYQEGKKLIEAKEIVKGFAIWRDIAVKATDQEMWEAAAWLYATLGDASADGRATDEAHKNYQAAIEAAKRAQRPTVLAWIWNAEAAAFEKVNELEKAELAYREALQILRRLSPERLVVANSLDKLGNVTKHRGDLSAAEDFFRKALAIRGKWAPDSLAYTLSLTSVGNVAQERGDLSAAEDFHRKALAICESLAPGSLDCAASLTRLGDVASARGDLATAEDSHGKALAVYEKLAPGSLDYAASLMRLGSLASAHGGQSAAEISYLKALTTSFPGNFDDAASLTELGDAASARGELDAAEDCYRLALPIYEVFAPEGLKHAAVLNNLGTVAHSRGDLAGAEDAYGKALAIREKLAPGSLDYAASLAGLGDVARSRGDLVAAEDLHRKALAIREELAPGSLAYAASLAGLGDVARSRGDLAAAKDLHTKALAIIKKLSPAGFLAARSLDNYLGNAATTRRNPGGVGSSYTKALTIFERLDPLGFFLIRRLHHGLRKVTSARNDPRAAERFRRALSIVEKLAPGSALEAQALYGTGVLYRKAGRRREAAKAFRRAIAALELQKGRLGGLEEVKAGFAAQYAGYYRDYIDVLLELDQPRKAFYVLERSRASSLLSMLAERDLVFSGDVPADLERKRRLIDADYDRVQGSIAKLDTQKDSEQIDHLLVRLRELRVKQADAAQSIRKASPRLASLRYPKPLDLSGTQKALDPGTVLLSYSIGKERSFLFVVQPARVKPGLSVFTLPFGEESLRQKVTAFRNLLQREAVGARGTSAHLATKGSTLFADLVEPAEKLIAGAERVLICPDGPLHTLPFGALVKGTQRGRPSYFVEWKPLHTVVSATVYAEIKKSRREGSAASPGVELAAFGDPKYPAVSREKAEEIGNPEVRSAVRRGYGLEPLPNTREEVEKIASLYAPGAAKYLGEAATEERAKAIGKDTRYIHFACHGLLDERFPLDSSLALTIPEEPAQGQDNGLLQAWEIFEKVRIDADLVTLSACETGLGKEMGGEGLVGLTRAFQYAGARSILASLWSVADESTAELMKRFYGYLKSGKSKDEALRQAQMDLIKDPSGSYSNPFHWAAFQINGDWR